MLSFLLVGPDASGLKKDAESRSIGSMTENVTLLISFAIVAVLKRVQTLFNTALLYFIATFFGDNLNNK